MPRKDEGAKELVLASWSDRFLAWLIDFIIIGFIVEAVTVLGTAFRPGMSEFFVTISFLSLAFFVYWTYMESTRGRSLGKNSNCFYNETNDDEIDQPGEKAI